MNNSINLPIIAYIRSPYREKFGIPRQPNLVQVQSRIEMIAPYNNPLAFDGIAYFSHLWLIWQFHENKNQQQQQFRPQIRPPRLGGNQKIGVFASRSMYRPAPLGLSVVRFVGIEQDNQGKLFLIVEGADLLDGTPIIDIKPYLAYADSIENAQSGYAQQQPQPKQVIWQDKSLKAHLITTQQVLARHLDELEQILALDPRPAYQHDPERLYAMSFANMNVHFKIDDTVSIISIDIV